MKEQPKTKNIDPRAEAFYDYYWWDEETGAGTGFLFEHPNSWVDTTYGNDEMPSCEHSLDFMGGPDRFVLRLWMDYPWVEERPLERQDEERFQLALYYCEDNVDPTYGSEWVGDLRASDDLHDLLHQLDDPGESLRTEIREMAAAHQKHLIPYNQNDLIDQLNSIRETWLTCEALPILNSTALVESDVKLTEEQRDWLQAYNRLSEITRKFEIEYRRGN